MALEYGIDFRSTAGLVTDPANCYAERNSSLNDYPTTTPQGNTVGWESGGNSVGAFDADAGLDPRIAGFTFTSGGAVADYRIDLPAPGAYDINIAFGDGRAGSTY